MVKISVNIGFYTGGKAAKLGREVQRKDGCLVNYILDDSTDQMADDGWMDACMTFEYVGKSLSPVFRLCLFILLLIIN